MDEDEGEEKGWQGWDVESDSEESSSSDGDWMNVDSDDDNDVFDVSDSEDERIQKAKEAAELEGVTPDAPEAKRVSTLATTKVHIQCIIMISADSGADFDTSRLCTATRVTTQGCAKDSGCWCWRITKQTQASSTRSAKESHVVPVPRRGVCVDYHGIQHSRSS